MLEKLEKNDSVDVVIDSMGSGGEGVAHYCGMALFIPFALKGEKVRAKIVSVGKDYSFGKLEEVLQASTARVSPPCPYFYKCGGCDLQHADYPAQLEYKREKVAETLKRIGKCDVAVSDCVASDKQLRYRNKLSLPVRRGTDNPVKIGFFAKRSHRLIEIEDCLLQPEWVKPLIGQTRSFMKMQRLTAYDETTGKGDIRHVAARETGGVLTVTFVSTRDIRREMSLLDGHLAESLGNSVNIYLNINKTDRNIILGEVTYPIAVKSAKAEVDHLKIAVHPKSFFQVNDNVREKIYAHVDAALTRCAADAVIDAYCGAGIMTARLNKKFSEVYGIEIEKRACEDAERLRSDNGLGYSILCGDCAEILPKLTQKLKMEGKRTAIVLDPPKKGCASEVLDAVNFADRLVYISCDAATLARDIVTLKRTFDIVSVQPFDMFSQTCNVETVVLFSKRTV